MKSFREIHESFNKPAKWKLYFSNSLERVYQWKIENQQYELVAEKIDVGEWEITFTAEMSKDNKQHTINATGTGNEMQVFATVLDIILKDVIPNIEANILSFSAWKTEDGKSTGRSKLYARMVKKYTPSGWKLKIQDTKSTMDFIFNKIG